MGRFIYKITFVMVVAFVLGCDSESLDPLTNKRIKEAIDNRMIDFRNTTLAKCRKAAIDRAVIYTDSLIAADYFMELSGTIPFPPKPIKPNFEGPIIIKDTIKATPILK
jgi:hypothetical protein